jgi:hypothetical protein
MTAFIQEHSGLACQSPRRVDPRQPLPSEHPHGSRRSPHPREDDPRQGPHQDGSSHRAGCRRTRGAHQGSPGPRRAGTRECRARAAHHSRGHQAGPDRRRDHDQGRPGLRRHQCARPMAPGWRADGPRRAPQGARADGPRARSAPSRAGCRHLRFDRCGRAASPRRGEARRRRGQVRAAGVEPRRSERSIAGTSRCSFLTRVVESALVRHDPIASSRP